MADDYTPKTGEVRADYIRTHTRNFDAYMVGRSLTSEQEFYGDKFDAWLDSVVAEKRAEWEAEHGEVEWEYGCRSSAHIMSTHRDRGALVLKDREHAEEHGYECPSPSTVRRPRAGIWEMWVPVNENGETPPAPKRRLRSCVEQWPECETGAYNPACCRFPKSCSATVYDESRVADVDLEPATDREDGSAER